MMQIRNANNQDIATIVDFQITMALETESLKLDPYVVKEGVSAVFTDPSKGCYWVAVEEGVVAASLMITYEWSDWRNGLVWWIQSVYVKPEYRKKGVYSQMYDHIKKQVERSDNIRGLRLYVDKRNVPAQKVYTRLGMNGSHYDTYEWMRVF
ncbi:MAG: GNAT family N-acetyltransferase [Prevotellaceae bacterium]|nr:GNAT family N-acetyltransferase [Prevotellaceae bacterium]